MRSQPAMSIFCSAFSGGGNRRLRCRHGGAHLCRRDRSGPSAGHGRPFFAPIRPGAPGRKPHPPHLRCHRVHQQPLRRRNLCGNLQPARLFKLQLFLPQFQAHHRQDLPGLSHRHAHQSRGKRAGLHKKIHHRNLRRLRLQQRIPLYFHLQKAPGNHPRRIPQLHRLIKKTDAHGPKPKASAYLYTASF